MVARKRNWGFLLGYQAYVLAFFVFLAAPLAAAAAFDAYPCAAAALRVIGHLDDSVRGAQPSSIDVPTVLKQSPAFWLVAQRALALVLTDAG